MSLGDQFCSVSSSKLHLLSILNVQVIEVKNKNALIKKQSFHYFEVLIKECISII